MGTSAWVKGNHTFKFGGSLDLQGYYRQSLANLQGTYTFPAAGTRVPYLVTAPAGTRLPSIGPYSVGFPYASLLLGAVATANIDPRSDVRFGKHQLGMYVQDSWKITPKFAG